MTQKPATPFPLGVMAGGPNGSDPAAEAAVAAQFRRFTTLMGATPGFMNGFVDAHQPIAHWAANASWTAWSWRQSSIAQSVIPVIGLPMATTADRTRMDAVYREFAAGQHDAALRGVVAAWRDQGYSEIYLRLGYEMNGDFSSWYSGADAGTRADWVSAFRHIADVVRTVPGANVKTVWNPNIQAGNTADVKGLYPGDAYVDVIAGDIYNPTYPRDLYNWERNDGTSDATFAEWFSNPVNRTHYWNYPAANRWNQISDGQSNTFSLRDMIDFAKAHGKPIAIAETGAGGDGSRAPMDDPAFPEWLARTLQSAAVPVAFVNIWDLNPGDGNWDFSAGDKPQEAAAWANWFGAKTLAPPQATIALRVSEDAYQGHAQFTVAVDGVQVGGVHTTTASHGGGRSDTFILDGTFDLSAHSVAITFLNDAWGGTSATDRNLYVDGIAIDGVAVPGATAALWSAGTVVIGTPPPAVAGVATSTLVFELSADAWQGDAQCVLALDGRQLGGVQTVQASHAAGQVQRFAFQGSFGAGPHQASVSFVNDAWGGTSGTDRNLYVAAVSLDGVMAPNAAASLYSNGTATIALAR